MTDEEHKIMVWVEDANRRTNLIRESLECARRAVVLGEQIDRNIRDDLLTTIPKGISVERLRLLRIWAAIRCLFNEYNGMLQGVGVDYAGPYLRTGLLPDANTALAAVELLAAARAVGMPVVASTGSAGNLIAFPSDVHPSVVWARCFQPETASTPTATAAKQG